MLDDRLPCLIKRHPHAIEPHALEAQIAAEPISPEPGRCEPQPRLLPSVDRVQRTDEGARPTRANLDHDEHGPLTRQEIDLVTADPNVPIEDDEPARSEVMLGGLLGSDPVVARFQSCW